MAYAASKITAEIQDRVSHVLENLSKLTLDLAKPGLKEEEREAVIQEIETAKKGLNFNVKNGKMLNHLYQPFHGCRYFTIRSYRSWNLKRSPTDSSASYFYVRHYIR